MAEITTTKELKKISNTIQLIAGTDSNGNVKYVTTSLSGGVLNPETYDEQKYGKIVGDLVDVLNHNLDAIYESKRTLLVIDY